MSTRRKRARGNPSRRPGEYEPDLRTFAVPVTIDGRDRSADGDEYRLRVRCSPERADEFEFYAPQAPQLLLCASATASREADRLMKRASSRRAHRGATVPQSERIVLDAITQRVTALVMALAGAEAQANLMIANREEEAIRIAVEDPQNKKDDPYSGGADRKWKSMLPALYGVTPNLGTATWCRFKQLVALRNQVIHSKVDESVEVFTSVAEPLCDAPHLAVLDVFDLVLQGPSSDAVRQAVDQNAR